MYKKNVGLNFNIERPIDFCYGELPFYMYKQFDILQNIFNEQGALT